MTPRQYQENIRGIKQLLSRTERNEIAAMISPTESLHIRMNINFVLYDNRMRSGIHMLWVLLQEYMHLLLFASCVDEKIKQEQLETYV